MSFLLAAVFTVAVGGMVWRILVAQPRLGLQAVKIEEGPERGVVPTLLVEHLSLVHTRGGTKERVLRFDRAWQRAGPFGPVYEVEAPRVLMAKVREMTFTLEADRGWFDPQTGNLRLAGNVHAASGAEREFYSDSADYAAESDELIARGKERPLRLIDHGSTIEARVLKTDGRFENIEIRGAAGELGVDLIQPERVE